MSEPCHIHNIFSIPNRDDVRNEVCQTLPTTKYKDDDHYYCLLHLPDENKNRNEFNKEKNIRMRDVEAKIAAIKAKSISDEQKENELESIIYDFRYVCFPEEIYFNRKEFKAFADFGWTTFKYVFFNFATFEKGAYFGQAKFTQNVTFNSAQFFKEIRFDGATFLQEADFNRIKINSDIYFDESSFKGKANFLLARFNYENRKVDENKKHLKISSFHKVRFFKEVDFRHSHFFQGCTFRKAKFLQETTFRGAKFYKNTSFKWVRFAGDTYFDKCRFREDVDFGSSIFASNSDIFFRRTVFYKNANFEYVTFVSFVTFESYKKNPIFRHNSFVSFQNVRNESTAKVIFNQLSLRPCWFLRVDSTNYIFNDVQWKNVDDIQTKNNTLLELSNINKLEKEKQKDHFINGNTIPKSVFENPKLLFKISCRQLAENAETNNRFEEASNFRRMAFETEWLEKKEKISNWIKNLVLESEKLKRRFGGSTNEEDKPILPTNFFGILRRSGDFFIHGLYRITSLYGESWSWALGVLLSLILVIFPIIYTQINFQTCSKDRPISASLPVCESKDDEIRKNCTCNTDQIIFTEAIVQSLTTATLQNVEYRKPLTGWGEFWIILEKILAPLQAALLALAIRRKFMR